MNVRVVIIFAVCCCVSGCVFNTHGNRPDDRRLLTRTKDLRHFVNEQVTLVGTARHDMTRGATLELRGGSVELPAYDWPAQCVDQRVSVTGLLFEERHGKDARSYRLGEVKAATRWSR